MRVSDPDDAALAANDEIVVHRRRCLGNGNCVEQAPGYFQQSEEDGRVEALQTVVATADAEFVSRAVALCPVGALVVRRVLFD
jgi:ferredoxin